jgi:hypothetical protein
MSIQNLVRLSQIKKLSLPDYVHINKVSKKLINQCQLSSHSMMIGYDIYDRFTMEYFPLRQNTILILLLATVQCKMAMFSFKVALKWTLNSFEIGNQTYKRIRRMLSKIKNSRYKHRFLLGLSQNGFTLRGPF